MSDDNKEVHKNARSDDETKVDKNGDEEFLKHLRAAGTGAFSLVVDQHNNDDTIGRSNRESHRTKTLSSSLSELFDSPKDTRVLEDTAHAPAPTTASSMKPVNNSQSQLPPRPPSIQLHNRTVSWGKNVEVEPTSRIRDIEQPVLMDGAGSSRMATTSPRSAETNNARLSLDDVLKASPFEAEVETNILKAIDERYQQTSFRTRPRSDTGTSTILTQVPDDSLHDFELLSPNPTTSVDGIGNDELNDDDEDIMSTKSRVLQHDEESQNQTRPLLSNSATLHRRGKSVEQNLFDLTEAMTALRDDSNSRHIEQQQQQQRPPQQPPANGEDFANNVVLISEQQEQQQQHKERNTKKIWSKITNKLPVLRENSGTKEESGGETSDDSGHADIEEGAAPSNTPEPPAIPHSNSNTSSTSRPFKKKNRRSLLEQTNDRFKEDWEVWNGFFRPRQGRVLAYVKVVLFYILVPLSGVAAILFYLVGNPPTGESSEGVTSTNKASASWIMLFCCRQIITFSLALTVQFLAIDFLALDTRIMLKIVGPIITLLVVQSKGWPFCFMWWSIFDFAMLSGNGAFAHHWGYWQSAIGLFNERNPSGNVVNNDWYFRILLVVVSVSAVVAVKRFLIGLYLGRQTFSHYGQQLAAVMNKMLLISEVAGLAKDLEKAALSSPETTEVFGLKRESVRGIDYAQVDDDDHTINTLKTPASTDNVIDMTNRDPLTGSLNNIEKLKLMQLLERWEEPEQHDALASNEIASISAVLRFRKALTLIQKRYPFSHAYGPADNREACIDSAQKVYNRLLRGTGEDVLQFETIALLALDDAGNINHQKAKDLVRVFRPDRQGNLTMLDFVKSCDVVYKEFRLLCASIENSSQIDRAFERMFNVIFYIIVLTIVLAQLGLNPLALFVSLGTIILGCAFIIGSASSKYFEGLLFIFARRPYGIGDLIQVGGVETDASLGGALPWVVEHVTLFETIVKFLPTNEQASLSNGSLASSRIINWARSPQAQFHIFLNFPLDTPYEKILIFKSAIEEYMRARPREWRALNGFRANRVVADKNYIEYIIVIQHREAWQQVGQVLDSKANLSSYCQEVAKQLNMHYQAPRLPVDLTYTRKNPEDLLAPGDNLDADKLVAEFQALARNKHNIRVC